MSRTAMKKTVPFKSPNKAPEVPQAGDDWVANRASTDVVEDPSIAAVVAMKPPEVVSEPVEAMKRFTIDVSESLHKRIKSQCAMRGTKMADVIREMLEQEFPKG